MQILFLGFGSLQPVFGQTFYFGTDLSYVNEMEDCGAVYVVGGDTTDVFQIMKEHGCNLARLRLWHTPAWYDQLNAGQRYSDIDDVRVSIQRAKSVGMDVLLAFHLSDNWADPGHQIAPSAWTTVLGNLPVLQDSLYNYIHSTLRDLGDDGLMPDIIQIGNETNRGILLSKEVNDAGWTLDWSRNGSLFNTAIDAVRDIEMLFQIPIRIALHIANPSDALWYYEQFAANGVTDFDIIGLSYYWPWHNHTIGTVGDYIATFKEEYPDKEVMILETAVPWTTATADQANNILNTASNGYSPPSTSNQKKWLIDLTQSVIDHGGSGVVYWEPAWVSTSCSTQWAQGSHWENCAFFDFDHALIEDGGIGWMGHVYDFNTGVNPEVVPSGCFSICGNAEGIWISIGEAEVRGGSLDVMWMSVDGRLFHRQALNPMWDDGRIWIESEGLPSGVYWVSIQDERGCDANGMIFIE